MELWIAYGDCGDYYCDGEHLLGVFDRKRMATEAAKWYATNGSPTSATMDDKWHTGAITYWGSGGRSAVVSERPLLLNEWNSDHVSRET